MSLFKKIKRFLKAFSLSTLIFKEEESMNVFVIIFCTLVIEGIYDYKTDVPVNLKPDVKLMLE